MSRDINHKQHCQLCSEQKIHSWSRKKIHDELEKPSSLIPMLYATHFSLNLWSLTTMKNSQCPTHKITCSFNCICWSFHHATGLIHLIEGFFFHVLKCSDLERCQGKQRGQAHFVLWNKYPLLFGTCTFMLLVVVWAKTTRKFLS